MKSSLRLLTLALLSSSTLALTECRKSEEEAAPKLPTITEREKWLTAPNWEVDNVTQEIITPSGAVTVTGVNLSNFAACSVDDIYHYRGDKTFMREEGPLVCPSPLQQPSTGTWEFASNETELVVKRGAITDRFPIRQLTAATLSYVFYNNKQPDGSQENLILNFKAK